MHVLHHCLWFFRFSLPDWNGAPFNQGWLENGAYTYQLRATNGSQVSYYAPVLDRQSNIEATDELMDASFDAYQNDFWKGSMTISRAGWVGLWVMNNGATPSFGTLAQFYKPGPAAFAWDGRDNAGQLLSGTMTVGLMWWHPVKDNYLFVDGNTPEVSGGAVGGAAPTVEVKTDPYRIFLPYEQGLNFVYRVSLDANVVIKLLPPGIVDLNDPSAIVVVDATHTQAGDHVVQAGDHVVNWFGDAGETNALAIGSSDMGAWNLAIEATSPTTSRSTLYYGVLQIGN